MTRNQHTTLAVIVIVTAKLAPTLADDAPKVPGVQTPEADHSLLDSCRYGAEDLTAYGKDGISIAEQETNDSFGKVWAFYSQRCGHKEPWSEDKFYRVRSGTTKEGKYLVSDRWMYTSPIRRTHTTFIYDCPELTATVMVFRGDGKKNATRIHMTLINRTR